MWKNWTTRNCFWQINGHSRELRILLLIVSALLALYLRLAWFQWSLTHYNNVLTISSLQIDFPALCFRLVWLPSLINDVIVQACCLRYIPVNIESAEFTTTSPFMTCLTYFLLIPNAVFVRCASDDSTSCVATARLWLLPSFTSSKKFINESAACVRQNDFLTFSVYDRTLRMCVCTKKRWLFLLSVL